MVLAAYAALMTKRKRVWFRPGQHFHAFLERRRQAGRALASVVGAAGRAGAWDLVALGSGRVPGSREARPAEFLQALTGRVPAGCGGQDHPRRQSGTAGKYSNRPGFRGTRGDVLGR